MGWVGRWVGGMGWVGRWVGGRGWGGRWGWVGSQRRVKPSTGTGKEPLRVLSKAQKQPQCGYMSGQDGHWEQFNTTCSLISAPQWHHTPHSGPSWIYMVR